MSCGITPKAYNMCTETNMSFSKIHFRFPQQHVVFTNSTIIWSHGELKPKL